MPEWHGEIARRLGVARLDPASEAQVAEELAQHLEDVYRDHVARGAAPAEARAAALAELEGDVVLGSRLRRTVRVRPEPIAVGAPAPGPGFLAGAGDDLRHAARALRRTPVFTLIAMLVIALGVGANTTIFSVVNAAILRPLPGARDPGELVAIFTSDFSGPRYGSSSYPDLEAFAAARDVFSGLTAFTPGSLSVSDGTRSERMMGEAVMHTYFGTLGVRPALGRFFLPEERVGAGTSTSVVISHDLWQRRFEGSRSAIGAPLRVNGQVLTVVGVAPEDFRGTLRGTRVSMWVPLSGPVAVTGVQTGERGDRGMMALARLARGVDIEAARAQLAVIASQLHQAYPDYWTDVNEQSRVVTIVPEAEARVPPQMRTAVLGFFALLLAVVGIVLLIACTNIANLMLSRASARRGEMGVRLALGATRGRIVRHLLTESVLLAVLGGVTGVLLSGLLLRSLALASLPMAVALDITLDVRVLAFAAAITLAVGILFGILPALEAARSPAPLLRESATRVTRLRLRHGLVVVQVAASLVLLVAGGLFLRSLLAVQQVDPGFEAENMVLMSFDPTTEGLSEEQAQLFYGQLVERAAALPGVRAATLAETVPLGLGWSRRSITVEGYEPRPGEDMEWPFNGVRAGYFETMGIRLVQGRAFTPADREGAPLVAIVNQAFARRFWPGRNPLGQRIGMAGSEGPFMEVVGVVPDGKYRSFTEEPTPYFYYSALQHPRPSMTLHVRVDGEAAPVVGALRREVRALAPALAPLGVTTLRQHLASTTMPQRIAALMLGVLGGLALLIAAVGLYGVISYAVAQRTREFGIRMALGALAGDVRSMVLHQGMRITALGLLIGSGIAAAVAWVIRGFLLIAPFDPVTFVVVPLLLAGAAVLASWIPARRATRADPLAAIRTE